MCWPQRVLWNNSGQFALKKLRLYLKSSLYSQVKIYRSALAAERHDVGDGGTFLVRKNRNVGCLR